MKHIVEAGTDAATVILFDPGAQPEDFDAQMQDQPADFLERLMAEGKVCSFETGADGFYLLHAFVDEPVPAQLLEYAREPITVKNFQVASGRVFFSGVEFAFRQDDSFLRRHPQMGQSFDVPPGRYRLGVYRTEFPDGQAERSLRREVGTTRYFYYQSLGWLVFLAILAVLGLILGYFQLPRGPDTAALLLGLLFLIALPFIVYRSPPYKETQRRHREIQRDYPSVIAHLEKEPGT